MLLLQHLYQETAPVFLFIRGRNRQTVTKNLIAIAWKMRMKNLITCHPHSLDSLAVPHSKEEFPIHRLFPVFGTAEEAQLLHIFLQIIFSHNSIIHPRPKVLLSSNQTEWTEVRLSVLLFHCNLCRASYSLQFRIQLWFILIVIIMYITFQQIFLTGGLLPTYYRIVAC